MSVPSEKEITFQNPVSAEVSGSITDTDTMSANTSDKFITVQIDSKHFIGQVQIVEEDREPESSIVYILKKPSTVGTF